MANKNWTAYLFTATLALSATTIRAEDNKTLEGGFFFSEQGCGGKTPSPTCVMSFSISGAAAKALYEKLKVKSTYDECTEGPMKTDGRGLRCYKREAGRYECDFGYSFKGRGLVESEVDC